ncbi:4-alpha-glucanotransferase [Nakamurella flavida]|uniref:4-alpha-glucanotransferase n=1 Tax=Nakamurella flavida TaxID=363630 RepID=A0A939C4G9_9ACTN|nr:4-alpha-glucanotransferase [Nakamurella flavida]MBM9475217.1 4-alpha-glucanotransferase [Nakamurella flavida]
MDPAVRALAQAHGIATEFWDWRGQHTEVAHDTVTAVLAALDVPAGSEQEAQDSLAALHRAHWTRTLPAFLVGRQGHSVTCWVHVTHGDAVDIRVDLEDGGRRDDLVQLENWTPPEHVDGRDIGEASFALPADLPLGYHTVRVWSGGQEASTTVVITPAFLGFPARTGDRRTWGVATQLYSVRSAQSWGVGDLTDLTDLAVWAGSGHGAGYVLVNPLHAAEPVAPMEPSPYLPTTRRFANPLYLRVERIPEFADLASGDRDAVLALRTDVHTRLDDLDRIDRDTAWTAKSAALRIVHAAGRTPGRDIAYAAFQHREGPGLQSFALWCALATVHGPDWAHWPAGLRHPGSPEVAAFAGEHADEVDFQRWLQWCLDEQLGAAQAAAVDAGMTLGIVHDLAVGVHPRGADAWSLQDSYAAGVSVGAPPDAFNQAGQDWAQPPWRPDRLAELGYAPFRELVATVLRHAGGVRVDHIIGLFRLWWIPAGHEPTQGTYVRYDHEAMIGILALEAHRAGALVVGEDLGTVEPWVRDFLRERGILGTSILWFEFEYGAGPDGGDRPLRPEWWREYCLASVTTHDLPPTAGYLAGEHVRLRHRLGLLTRTLEDELAADGAEREAWLQTLRERGAVPADGEVSVEDLVIGLHRYLTWTPSRLLCVSLTDAVGDPRTQNQPGTIDEYPNWRVPLSGPDGTPIGLEDVLTSRRAARLFDTVRG